MPLKALKNLAKKVLPGPASWWASWKLRQALERYHGDLRREMAAKLFGRSVNRAVVGGPFAGMAYIDDTVWGPIAPKWIGTYELELWPVWKTVGSAGYTAFVDVGCAEGYYAVGLARTLDAPVYAFDLDAFARRQCRRLARLNGVEKKVIVAAKFDPRMLSRLRGGKKLVLMDVEGAELELLDGRDAQFYRDCDILVEVHLRGDRSIDAMVGILQGRFEVSHWVECYNQVPRRLEDAGDHVRRLLGDSDTGRGMDEGRSYPQKWLWMRSRS